MANIAGCCLNSTSCDLDLDGMMHFNIHETVDCYRHSVKYSDWLKGIHIDDRTNIENTLFELFSGKVECASFTFRRQGIDGSDYKLTCYCRTNADHPRKRISIKQNAYMPKFEREQHISHQHWITSPYHFYHYKKLLDDMNYLVRNKKECTLFYFNIDKLKALVNKHGYNVIDRVYSCIFSSLNNLASYPISRYQSILGNFVVIIGRRFTHREIEEICESILTFSHQQFMFSPIVGQCDLSLGATSLPSNASSPRDILRNIARASGYALEKKQCNWAIHEDQNSLNIDRHFYIEKELCNAINNDELAVKYQPIIDANTGKIASLEVLSRWESSMLGEVYPDEFIPVAESQHLISQLGWQVLNKACQFLKGLPDTMEMCVNVNVSVLQLQAIDFATTAFRIVSEYHIEPSKIVFEITESLLLDNSSLAGAQLRVLSKLGFRLSLDDFGSGYSTLNSLFSLPINQIKLDKETALQAMQNKEAMNYIRFLIDMCQRNRIEFLVEGIETLEMLECYRLQGVHQLQGYYFTKALSPREVIVLLEKNDFGQALVDMPQYI